MANLVDQGPASFLKIDEPHAFVAEDFGESGSDHTAVPWTPTYGDHAGGRNPRGELPGSFVEHLVRHGIVHLAFATKASRGRREKNHELEGVDIHGVHEGSHASDLRPEDPGKLLHGLVLDELIRKHAGPVNETGDGSELLANVSKDAPRRRTVADIHRAVLDMTTGSDRLC